MHESQTLSRHVLHVAHFLDRSICKHVHSHLHNVCKNIDTIEEMAKVIYNILGHIYVHVPHACKKKYQKMRFHS